jgi:probable rRNA maturation factor
VHGVLHLQGHDHVRAAAAKRMEGLETRILAKLGYADPYAHATPSSRHGTGRERTSRRRLPA